MAISKYIYLLVKKGKVSMECIRFSCQYFPRTLVDQLPNYFSEQNEVQLTHRNLWVYSSYQNGNQTVSSK